MHPRAASRSGLRLPCRTPQCRLRAHRCGPAGDGLPCCGRGKKNLRKCSCKWHCRGRCLSSPEISMRYRLGVLSTEPCKWDYILWCSDMCHICAEWRMCGTICGARGADRRWKRVSSGYEGSSFPAKVTSTWRVPWGKAVLVQTSVPSWQCFMPGSIAVVAVPYYNTASMQLRSGPMTHRHRQRMAHCAQVTQGDATLAV